MDVFGVWAAEGRSFPAPPYLRPPGRWRDPPAGFRIGLVTAGNPNLVNNARRSLSPDDASRLRAALPGQVLDLDPRISRARDFADTAALIDGMDLIVTVDTAVAHLAGAMDKACLVMLPGYGTDWRWQRERADTPWYPSLRLYRNTLEGSWDGVFAAVASDAAAMAGAASPG